MDQDPANPRESKCNFNMDGPGPIQQALGVVQ